MRLDNFNQLVGSGIEIYGSRERIRNQLIANAKTYLELQTVDFYKTSVISYIIDTLSILSANHLFYDSVIYREFFMVEAQMQESVYNLASWIGYEVPKAKPSTVDIMFTIPLTFAGDDANFVISNDFMAYSSDVPFMINSLYTTAANTTAESLPAAVATVNRSSVNLIDIPTATGKIINNSAVTVKDSSGFYRPIYIYNDGTTKTASFTLPFTQHEKKIFQFIIPSGLQAYQFYSKILEFSGMVSNMRVWVAEPKYGQKLILDNISSPMTDPVTGATKYDSNYFNPNIPVPGTQGSSSVWVPWTESPHGVYTMSSGSDSYVFVGGQNKGELFFGNGIIGRQPNPNSAVTVELYLTRGEEGHVIPNTITRGDKIYYSVTPTYNREGQIIGSENLNKTTAISYKITNNTQSMGGENTPSLPEIKRNAIINLRSKKRLVSEEDYNDINTIVEGQFPVVEAYPVLKRSDIKVNEIMTFLRLLYHDEFSLPQIVPTRNVKLPVYNPSFVDGKYTVLRNSKVLIDDEYYQTLYNITIDNPTLMASYDYVLQNITGSPVALYQEEPYSWYQQFTYIPINTIDVTVDLPSEVYSDSSSSSSGSNQQYYAVKFKVNVNHIPADRPVDYQLSQLRCRMITKWGGNDEYSESYAKYILVDDINEPYNKQYQYFEFEIPNYLNVPTEMQRYEFHIDGYGLLRDKDGAFVDENGDKIFDEDGIELTDYSKAVEGWIPISKSYTDIMVRKDLSDVMLSTVTKTDYWDGQIHTNSLRYDIHNVPVILSSYLTEVLARADNLAFPNFEVTVMQDLLKNLDISNKRMLTDFINIKYPDTHGTLNNLKYNPVDYVVRSRYHTPFKWENPDGIIFVGSDDGISSSSGYEVAPTDLYIVNGEVPGYQSYEVAKYMDYIAQLYRGVGTGGADVWYLTKPKRGTYIKVKDEIDSVGDYKILAYDGDAWKDVQAFTIPLQIKLKIEMDEQVTVVSSTLKQTIKDALVGYFSPYMGTQKELDRSEISKVVRGISGVKFCEVLSPEIDIRFKYDIRKDLTQEQLLEYTPQYVGFTEDDIQIDII